MQSVDVTPRVWDRLLAARANEACLCCGAWTVGEQQALSLYGALAQPPAKTSIVAQIGQSLDGRIATVTGDAQNVSGPDGLAHLHRLRALVDAVVIGVKTALHDNPRLTVRLVKGENPARVVIDPNGRLPDDTDLLHDQTARRIVIQTVDKPRPKGVEVIRLPRNRWIAPQNIVSALAGVGLHRLLIEGGAITIAQFLEADVLTRLHVAVAPLLIGAGPQGFNIRPVSTLAEARRPETQIYGLGSDVLFDCALSPAEASTSLPRRTAHVG
jgi:riboflavin-specific deaminase-like protein